MIAQETNAVLAAGDAHESSSPRHKPRSRLLQLRAMTGEALLEHIYKTEDTLFQIAFDKRVRPELYQLRTEEVLREDTLKRYESLCE